LTGSRERLRRTRRPPDRLASVAVIGAGVAGISTAVSLMRAGVHSFIIFEQSGGPGGTWHDNAFPGAGCDVPSHLYSFSFYPRQEWCRVYAKQPEILGYLEEVFDRFGLRAHARFNTAITRAEWNEERARWTVTTGGGERLEFDFVVSCVGFLNVPKVPQIRGIEAFGGRVVHTARWDTGLDLGGRRVGVVGTGSTAAQLVPAIAELVEHLYVFQREPGWVVPKKDREYSAAELARFARSRWAARKARWAEYWRREINSTGITPGSRVHRRNTSAALEWLSTAVRDPDVRDALTPRYPYGCKRPVKERDYYLAFNRDNVSLITQPISAVERTGLRTGDGRRYGLDLLVLATGFKAADFLCTLEVVGKSGTELHALWAAQEGPEAFLGLMVAGFPNLFMLYGPNTNSSTTSLIFVLEAQARFVAAAVRSASRRGEPVEIASWAQRVYNRWLQRKMPQTTWSTGCRNYFTSPSGKLVTNWPHTSVLYRLLTVLCRPCLAILYERSD
jgi:cation diffusion facilitator CzcD-associated flavoprotein CzcO